MTRGELNGFRNVWLVDFEFHQPDGFSPKPICMVALEMHTGQYIRVWQDDLLSLKNPPFRTSPDDLFVAYYASAECSCYRALGWPMPARVLDLCAEFKCLTSGRETPCGKGVMGALAR